MDIDNQKTYWDSVANSKTFTHPVDLTTLEKLVQKDALIIDYGCGYGRVVHQLRSAGYKDVRGYDTSAALVARGKLEHPDLQLFHITDPEELPTANNSVECFLLMAVLTCIPSNNGQQKLVELLSRKLKPGGLIFISDYYIDKVRTQDHGDYVSLDGDPLNYGVFTLPEGATFRHHTREWIAALLNDFEIVVEKNIKVQTMNGFEADAFQLFARKR